MFGMLMVVTPGLPKYSTKSITSNELIADEDFTTNFHQAGRSSDPGTDAYGIENYQFLIPGAVYRCYERADEKGQIYKSFVAKSGQTHDLGDAVVDLNK